jgi:hypothetical protein
MWGKTICKKTKVGAKCPVVINLRKSYWVLIER